MPGGQYQASACPARRDTSQCSLTDGSSVGPEDEDPRSSAADPLFSPLQRLTAAMCTNEKVMKELMIGRRVGFYKVRGEIGCGTFSRVKLAYHALTKDKVALKILDKTRLDTQAQALLSQEISNMEGLQHPNVVRLYEVLETPCRLYLVLEYGGGGDLHTRICDHGKMADNCCKVAFAQILSAIKYLHNHNIIHRDLKAENVLLTGRRCVKVADFGFSKRVSAWDDALDTFCGSPPYAAPELFRDESYAGPAVDVWAMGVLLFFMVTGAMPFRADTLGRLRRCVLDGAYAIPPWVPGPCQRLLRGMLRPLAQDRHAVDQMLGCDWLLPVEFPWPLQWPASPVRRDLDEKEAEDEELEEEVRAGLGNLGFAPEHAGPRGLLDSRSPGTGAYRILMHRAQKRRGCDTVPVVRGMVRDPKRESLRAYKGLVHTSKFCVIS